MSAYTNMALETAEIPDVIQRQREKNAPYLTALAEVLRKSVPSQVIIAGRGSSAHAGIYGKYLIEGTLGIPVGTAALSMASLYNTPLKLQNALVIVISQSGKSPDLVQYAENARKAGARVVVLVNQADSPLAKHADFILPLHAGVEKSVCATKSYVASLFAQASLLAAWTQDSALADELYNLPDFLDSAMQSPWEPLVDGLATADNLFVIGRGVGLAIAHESALKLKETSQIHAEAYSSADILHGPLAMVRAGFPILAYLQHDASYDSTRDIIQKLRSLGGRVFVVDSGEGTPDRLVVPAVSARLTPLLQITRFYKAAEAVARERQCNPDQPPHLNKVTETR